MSVETAKWVPITNTILVGWNVGLVFAVLAAIVIGSGSSFVGFSIVGALATAFVVIVSIVVGIVVGVFVARRVRHWFESVTAKQNYLWFVSLMVVTLLLFPAPFSYVVP